MGLPPSLSGRTVLDVGAWDGFYSFEAARRGARRVLATDSFCWSGEGWGTKDGFLLARDALGLPVDDLDVDVMDLSPERVGGKFDVVLLLGVLYHLRDPVTALERVADVTGDLMVIETETSLAWLRQPTATIYAGRELNDVRRTGGRSTRPPCVPFWPASGSAGSTWCGGRASPAVRPGRRGSADAGNRYAGASAPSGSSCTPAGSRPGRRGRLRGERCDWAPPGAAKPQTNTATSVQSRPTSLRGWLPP